MRKKNLVKMATITLAMTMALAGCTGGSSETPSTSEKVEITTTVEDTTGETTDKETTEGDTTVEETPEATSEDESTTVEDTTEEESTTEENTSGEGTSTEENTSGEGTSTEEPTSEDESTTIETTTEKETETEPKAPETTVEPTTTEPETTKVPETKPAETEPTKPSETETITPTTSAPIATPTSISASVSGTHYIGDTLGAADFTVKVSMSDGSVLSNPAGWTANKLKLDAATTSITVSYGGVSTTISVNASERPVETQPQPTQPSEDKQIGSTTTYSGGRVLRHAADVVDTPYVAGGTTPSGFDCSGLVAYCYAKEGVAVPSSAAGQATCGTKIGIWQAVPGDIVVYKYKDGSYHTGLYFKHDALFDSLQTSSYGSNGVDIRPILNEWMDYSTLDKVYAVRVGNNTDSNITTDVMMREGFDWMFNYFEPSIITYEDGTTLEATPLMGDPFFRTFDFHTWGVSERYGVCDAISLGYECGSDSPVLYNLTHGF